MSLHCAVILIVRLLKYAENREIIVILAHPCDSLRDDGKKSLLAFQSHTDGVYRLRRAERFQACQQGIGLQAFAVVLP